MHEKDEDLSIKDFFIPFTTAKALHFLILIGVVVFFNGLFNTFVQDDHAQIVNKPIIHSLTNIISYFFESRLSIGEQRFIGAMYYKPLLDTAFAIIYSIGGATAFWFHFFQIVLTITNACLVFFLFKRFFSGIFSFFLALLFLVHPINSESAFYISAMQEVLFFFFGMVALLLFKKPYSHKNLFFISVLLLCSLLSKETGVLFLGIILVYAYLFQREIILRLLGYILGVLGVYALLRVHAIGVFTSSVAVSPIETLSLAERLLHIPSLIIFYLETFLFPYAISSSHQWTYRTVNFQNFYMPLMVVLVFIVVTVGIGSYIYKYKKELGGVYLFFAIWFTIGVSFHLQIFPLDQTVAERWFYFPFVGLLGMIGVAYMFVRRTSIMNNHQIKLLVLAFVGIMLSLLAFWTILRSFDFRNDFVLASADIKVSPESYNLEYILSRQYYDQGKLQEAKQHAQKSIHLFPLITNYTNLGAVYSRMEEYDEAKKAYVMALEYGEDALPYENLASLALIYGDTNESIKFLKEKALKKYPENGKLWFSLALLEYRSGNKQKAQEALAKTKLYYNMPLIQVIDTAFQQNKKVQVTAKNGVVNFSVE